MEHIYAPWRKDFIEKKEKEEGCIFCKRKDLDISIESLVIFKGKLSFILLNKYPYNNGHLMVAPYSHKGDFTELDDDEINDLSKNIKFALSALKKAYNPQGFNIGMNLGSVAGAGVADHLHWHIVPRWGGDTNFMPVTGETKVLHEILSDTFERLLPVINDLKNHIK
ncbi:MAG: HIT domain-containing protein [Proteobacteria bacterium]|nr:HIT domain-containing protein [Pseudomonadota bacterium]